MRKTLPSNKYNPSGSSRSSGSSSRHRRRRGSGPGRIGGGGSPIWAGMVAGSGRTHDGNMLSSVLALYPLFFWHSDKQGGNIHANAASFFCIPGKQDATVPRTRHQPTHTPTHPPIHPSTHPCTRPTQTERVPWSMLAFPRCFPAHHLNFLTTEAETAADAAATCGIALKHGNCGPHGPA